ncbi:MAG: uroporphyrinogen decarboxylase family protein [Lentisphaerae bacterium]|nr:uroporphyrinogen decarboxylase family protein [Lentisphaerota bacterium]
MKSIDRVRAIVNGQPVDHLPAQPMVMMFAAKHIGMPYIEYTRDSRKMAEAQVKVARDFGIDCLLTCSDPAREVIDIAGDGSVEWFDDQGPAIHESRAALKDKSRLQQFKVPDPLGGGRMHDRVDGIRLMRREAGPDVSIVGWVEGPLALAQELRGLNTIMTDFIDDPDFVRELLTFTADVAIRYAPAQIDAGADTIGMSDAAASLMGPHFYAEYLFPQQLRVLSHIKRRYPHVLTRLHMCGQTAALLSQMCALPADILELDFPVDLVAARRAFGPRRVISGNVSTITDLMEGTPERVYAAAQRCHAISGGYHIVNSGCEVSPRTPPENLRALIRYAQEHGPADV